jgi:maltooligosyltrehalose trehalohydrolase
LLAGRRFGPRVGEVSMLGESYTAVGALYADGRTTFRVWAPLSQHVEVHVTAPFDKATPMQAVGNGYFEVAIESVEPGARYTFRLGPSTELPDPASRYQRDGPYGASEVTDPEYPWTDWGFRGLPIESYDAQEVRAERPFDEIVAQLGAFADRGATTVELSHFTALPYAPTGSLGGPRAMKDMVDECHARGLCVVLDVDYSRLDPFVGAFGPYLARDGSVDVGSVDVRNYLIGNALYWLDEFHVDALRVDAAPSLLAELADVFRYFADRTRRQVHLVAAQ